MRIYSDRFHVGGPTHVGPITLFPVWSETRSTIPHQAGPYPDLQVEELDEPEVGSLILFNPTVGDLLVPEGTVLAGGNQTRVLCHDTWLDAESGLEVDVRCVEQGRWGSRVDGGVAGRVPAPIVAALRGVTMPSETRRPADQGEVWRQVDTYQQVFGQRATSSLLSVMMRGDEDRIEEPDPARRERLRAREDLAHSVSQRMSELARHPLPGQNGIMVGMSGQPIMLEIFNDEAAFRSQLGGILQAAAVDAPRASGEPTPGRRAVRMAEAVMDTALVEEGGSDLLVGAGDRVDIRSLITGRETVHTAALNTRHALVMAQ